MASANVEQLQDEIAALRANEERMAQAASQVAVVIRRGSAKCVVTTGCGPSIEVMIPSYGIGIGDTVTLDGMSGQIIDKAQTTIPGSVAIIRESIDEETFELEGTQEHRRAVVLGPNVTKVDKGCRVLLDSTGHVILANLGRPGAEYVRGETAVDWNEIGGLDNIKQELIEAVEHPHQYPDLYASYNQSPPKGVMLQGPPGNGKTMCGKAIATGLSRIYEKENRSKKLLSSAFLYVKGPEILTKWVGESESKIREIFDRAREHKKEYGFPAVVFIDEADAILSKRGTGVSSDMEKTIVPMFLSEMDGLDDSSAIVILATNRPKLIDPAVMRDGRIDRKFYVQRPSPKAAKIILSIYLKKVPLASDIKVGDLATLAMETLFSNERSMGTYGTTGSKVELFLRDLVSGASLKNVVDLAVSSAIRRDIIAERKRKGSGVNERDILHAIAQLQEHASHADNSDVLEEIKENEPDRVQKPKKAISPAAATVAA